MSVGTHVSFGQFRAIHLGDLTKNKEFELMCPNNRIGTVDVLLGLHHGVDSSNSDVLVHALRPRVAIMNNGTRKGGQPEVMKTVHSSPGLEDLWQVHFSQLTGQEYTVPGMFIANTPDEPLAAMPVAPMSAPQPGQAAPPAPVHNGTAYWIKVSAQADGSFSVTNGRNGFSKTYAGVLAASSAAAQRGPAPDSLVKENATVKLAEHPYLIPDFNVGLVPNVGVIVGSRATLVIMRGVQSRARELKAQGRSVDDTATTVQVEFQAKHPEWPRGNGLAAAARAAYAEAP